MAILTAEFLSLQIDSILVYEWILVLTEIIPMIHTERVVTITITDLLMAITDRNLSIMVV